MIIDSTQHHVRPFQRRPKPPHSTEAGHAPRGQRGGEDEEGLLVLPRRTAAAAAAAAANAEASKVRPTYVFPPPLLGREQIRTNGCPLSVAERGGHHSPAVDTHRQRQRPIFRHACFQPSTPNRAVTCACVHAVGRGPTVTEKPQCLQVTCRSSRKTISACSSIATPNS